METKNFDSEKRQEVVVKDLNLFIDRIDNPLLPEMGEGLSIEVEKEVSFLVEKMISEMNAYERALFMKELRSKLENRHRQEMREMDEQLRNSTSYFENLKNLTF